MGLNHLPPHLVILGSWTPSSPGCSGVIFPSFHSLEATHRGLYKFLPRHSDEIEVGIGDPIYVMKESDDLWCEGKSHTFRPPYQAAIQEDTT